jgi:hypothetical protein
MATVGALSATLSDWARRVEPDGKIAKIVEILSDTNEILDDMMWMESNQATSHVTTVRSGLPSVAWRLLNYGVQPSKSRTVQVTDTLGMLEAYSEVDKDLADLNGNTSEFRLSEDVAFIEAMSQECASTIFYGNTATDPKKFLGLAPRYNDSTAENGENILKGGGSGSDNTSVWLVAWGDNTCHGLFPKGKKTGLQHKDLGEDTLVDAAGGKYQGYRSHYKWDAGFTLRDWRFVVRICNIDISNLTKDASGTSADLVDLMVQALEVLPSMGRGKPVFYCNKTVRSFLRRQISNKDNVNLTLENVGGKHVLNFDGVPVRKCDAILNTESTVS